MRTWGVGLAWVVATAACGAPHPHPPDAGKGAAPAERSTVDDRQRRQIADLSVVLAEENPDPVIGEARSRYGAGRRAHLAGRFADAARLFVEAHGFVPHPQLLYAAMLSYEKAGDRAAAVDALCRFLADGEGLSTVADARRHLSKLGGRCPSR
jgi:hypothetical protein